MKARVKATGEIVELLQDGDMYYCTNKVKWFHAWELDFIDDTDEEDNPDYWTRLEHQYAGMAMQGLMTILPQIGGIEGRSPKDEIVDMAVTTAHALVEKMKEERK